MLFNIALLTLEKEEIGPGSVFGKKQFKIALVPGTVHLGVV